MTTQESPTAALPCEWYVEARVLEAELERIFERSWQCVGVIDRLAAPGDYITGQVGRIPVVVIRDLEEQLRGFVNVCLHRCSIIASGCGNLTRLQCPYHAWTYGLDGRLIAAPRFKNEPGFEFADFRLTEIQVSRLGPLVMVNADRHAASLSVQLDGLEERMREDGLSFDGLVNAGHWESEQEANWKVLVENFNECYHCPVAHPQFSQLLAVDPEHYRLETAEWTSRAVVPLRPGGVEAIDGYPDGENSVGQYALLWPSFTLSQSPGPRRVVACWFEPINAHRTRIVCETLVDPSIAPDEIAMLDRFSTQVATEDQALAEAVQRGLESRQVARPHLMASTEELVVHFDRLVAKALDGVAGLCDA